MNFKKYNNDYALIPVGLENIGFTCYFNSLLQALISCTSFVETILILGKDSKDPIILVLYHIISSTKLLETDINEYQKNQIRNDLLKLGPVCWKIFMRKLHDISPNIAKYFIGQQCAAEAFTLLLEIFDKYKSIQSLFTYRRINKIYCPDCKQTFATISEINNVFEIESPNNNDSDKKYNLNDVLLKQMYEIDKNCKCSNCNIKSNKIKSSNLVMIPEILFIVCKKYKYDTHGGHKLDISTDFPEDLYFPGKDNEKLIYKIVAQIQHSGSLNSGHYWAICKRKPNWYCINDSNISKSEFKSDIHTYILLYHIS